MKRNGKPRTTVDVLLEQIGYKYTLELCRRFHGRKLLVPLRIPDIHPIKLTVGDWASDKMQAMFGGDTLEIPDDMTVIRIRRDAEIRRRYFNERAGRNELAQEFGLTRKQVGRILDQADGNANAVAIAK